MMGFCIFYGSTVYFIIFAQTAVCVTVSAGLLPVFSTGRCFAESQWWQVSKMSQRCHNRHNSQTRLPTLTVKINLIFFFLNIHSISTQHTCCWEFSTDTDPTPVSMWLPMSSVNISWTEIAADCRSLVEPVINAVTVQIYSICVSAAAELCLCRFPVVENWKKILFICVLFCATLFSLCSASNTATIGFFF